MLDRHFYFLQAIVIGVAGIAQYFAKSYLTPDQWYYLTFSAVVVMFAAHMFRLGFVAASALGIAGVMLAVYPLSLEFSPLTLTAKILGCLVAAYGFCLFRTSYLPRLRQLRQMRFLDKVMPVVLFLVLFGLVWITYVGPQRDHSYIWIPTSVLFLYGIFYAWQLDTFAREFLEKKDLEMVARASA